MLTYFSKIDEQLVKIEEKLVKIWMKTAEIRLTFTKLSTSITPYWNQKLKKSVLFHILPLTGFLKIPLTTLYDYYIHRPKLSEQKKPIWFYSSSPLKRGQKKIFTDKSSYSKRSIKFTVLVTVYHKKINFQFTYAQFIMAAKKLNQYFTTKFSRTWYIPKISKSVFQ